MRAPGEPLFIRPRWDAPGPVRVVTTTRQGGVSAAPYDRLNLAESVGDDPNAVARNRARLAETLALAEEPDWLVQVHGCGVVSAAAPGRAKEADASWVDRPGPVCAVLTADCMPVVLTNRAGDRVAVAHAGWRGLAGGVLEAAVAALDTPGEDVLAWLGPAIGPDVFEVGAEVRDAFLGWGQAAAAAFRPSPAGRWLADLYELARLRLQAINVGAVSGGEYCTYNQSELFYSYRRDGARTGRMATLAWLAR